MAYQIISCICFLVGSCFGAGAMIAAMYLAFDPNAEPFFGFVMIALGVLCGGYYYISVDLRHRAFIERKWGSNV